MPSDIHIPPFARWPYQPFSREAVVQIALREWRAFGQQIVYPDTELPFDNERLEGLWQRVGEYWWLGLPMGADEQGLTGKHDENGIVFPPEQDGRFAWSAAFVSYVMRMAGAGPRFPYSGTHADYINAARLNPGRLVVAAERPETYAPRPGDLICLSRGRPLRFDDLPAGKFASHCDIVVATAARPARSDRRQCRKFGRRCGTSRSRRTAGWSGRTEGSSIPITRGLSCCDLMRRVRSPACSGARRNRAVSSAASLMPKRSARR